MEAWAILYRPVDEQNNPLREKDYGWVFAGIETNLSTVGDIKKSFESENELGNFIFVPLHV